MSVLLDFDGTVVDVWARYHAVFCECAGIGPEVLDLGQYRELKLSLHRDGDIMAVLDIGVPDGYWDRKRALLEDDGMLALDEPIAAARDLLRWAREAGARLLSRRRDPEALFRQLARMGLDSLIADAVVLGDGESKDAWVAENVDPDTIVIGDSPEDVRAGLAAGGAVFVETGLWVWDEIHSEFASCELGGSLADIVGGHCATLEKGCVEFAV